MAESIKQYLCRHEFFSELRPKDLDFLAGCAALRQLEEDDVLFRHGDDAQRFFLLKSGQMSIEVANIAGPPLEMQILEPGELVGWSWLIPPFKWRFQARAVEPAEVVEFDGKAVFERCEKDAKFGYIILKYFSSLMSERLDFAREKMKEEWSPPGFA